MGKARDSFSRTPHQAPTVDRDGLVNQIPVLTPELIFYFLNGSKVPDLSDLSPYLFTSATVRIRVQWTLQFFDPLFTPFAPLQKLHLNHHPFLCVNKSPIRYGFFAGAILTYPQTYPS